MLLTETAEPGADQERFHHPGFCSWAKKANRGGLPEECSILNIPKEQTRKLTITNKNKFSMITLIMYVWWHGKKIEKILFLLIF